VKQSDNHCAAYSKHGSRLHGFLRGARRKFWLKILRLVAQQRSFFKGFFDVFHLFGISTKKWGSEINCSVKKQVSMTSFPWQVSLQASFFLWKFPCSTSNTDTPAVNVKLAKFVVLTIKYNLWCQGELVVRSQEQVSTVSLLDNGSVAYPFLSY